MFKKIKAAFERKSRSEARTSESEHESTNKQTGRLMLYTISILGLICLLTWWFLEPTKIGETDWSWALFAFYSSLAYFAASFRWYNPVPIDNIAVRTFLQIPYDETGAGPIFAPLGFVQVRTFPINIVQQEYPAEPGRIFRPLEGESTIPPEGFKPPLRITFNDSVTKDVAKELLGVEKTEDGEVDKEATFKSQYHYYYWQEKDPAGNILRTHEFVPEAAKDGLASRVTAEISYVIRWRIVQGKGTNFVRRIGTPANFDQQIEDEMASLLQAFLPKISVGQALVNLTMLNAILHEKVRRATEDWGVEIVGAYMKQIQFHRALNSAIGEKAEAPFAGEAKKTILTREGEGAAAAAAALEQKVLEARAKGYKKIAVTIDVSGAEAQAGEVARSVGDSPSTVVLGESGLNALYGIASMVRGDSSGKPGPDDTKKGDE